LLSYEEVNTLPTDKQPKTPKGREGRRRHDYDSTIKELYPGDIADGLVVEVQTKNGGRVVFNV
jgi:hypothetical protein